MKIKKIKPDVKLCLSFSELDFFYKLLLLCEGNKKLNGYNYKNPELQNFIEYKDITITYKKAKKWTGISQKSITNEIQFKHTRNSVCASLFFHLRNAFAHGYIEKDSATNTLHFQNFHFGECVMDGKMTYENLSELINKMYLTKQKRNNEKANF